MEIMRTAGPGDWTAKGTAGRGEEATEQTQRANGAGGAGETTLSLLPSEHMFVCFNFLFFYIYRRHCDTTQQEPTDVDSC